MRSAAHSVVRHAPRALPWLPWLPGCPFALVARLPWLPVCLGCPVAWWPGGLVAWWPGGLVAWWPGGLVARWPGGPVPWWPGGPVAWWPGGLVARCPGGLVARWLVAWRDRRYHLSRPLAGDPFAPSATGVSFRSSENTLAQINTDSSFCFLIRVHRCLSVFIGGKCLSCLLPVEARCWRDRRYHPSRPFSVQIL
jgi:hypothetical protein